MLDKFRISVAKVAKIMDSWFKDTAIIYSYGRGYLNNKKISKRRRVFPARGQSWNANSQKKRKIKRFKHELKVTFFSTFYAY